jgi:hypothetical protein
MTHDEARGLLLAWLVKDQGVISEDEFTVVDYEEESNGDWLFLVVDEEDTQVTVRSSA